MMMMRTAADWLTPVKASGMAAYLIATLACAAMAVRSADKRVIRLASILCTLDLALLLDMAFDWRWKLYFSLKGRALSHNWYNERSEPQIAALVIIAAIMLVAAAWLGRRFAPIRGAPLAICGALLSVGCWLTEVVSLHATDAVLYHHSGPLMVVSFAWMLASAMTAAGILMAGRHAIHKS